jgi:putative tryptophan/tyrosine transport system substrate-binding protein
MRFGLVPLLLLAAPALAETPVIVTEASVAQFRQAANAAKKHLPGAIEVDPSDPNLGARLAGASVILAVGQNSLAATRRTAPTKPVVFCVVLGMSDALLARNVTGVSLEADPATVLSHMISLHPGLKRLGVIFNPQTNARLMVDMRARAQAHGLELVAAGVSSPSAVKAVYGSMAQRVDAVWLAPDAGLFNREIFRYLLGRTAERRIPLYGFLDSFTEEGALASFAPDYEDIGERAGRMAQQISARDPAQRVPVPEPTYAPGRLSINVKTARALGIEVPDAALTRARHVYR